MVRHAAVTVTAFMALLGAACSGGPGEGRTAVASLYPLAFTAERIAGPGWEVIDLTPPGTEAHDVELSVEDRAALEEADLVLYLGDLGFQPQVEDAVEENAALVVSLYDVVLDDAEGEQPPPSDPHLWLDAGNMRTFAQDLWMPFQRLDPAGTGYRERADDLAERLGKLADRYEQALDPSSCRYDVGIVPHEAFGYVLSSVRGFRQFGLSGVNPEGEPTAARLSRVLELISSGRAGAVFYEVGGASQGVAETVARDAGAAALPLSTLESQPEDGDYLSVMEQNLESLRRGLGCP